MEWSGLVWGRSKTDSRSRNGSANGNGRDGEDVGVDCLVLVHKKVESVLYLHLVFQRAMHRQPSQMDLKQLG